MGAALPALQPVRQTGYDSLKRIGDAAVAGVALTLLAPVLLGTALAVRVCLGRNVLFRQERPGRDGQIFEILKFRTMHEPDPSRGLVTDEQRMTPLGGFLRAMSLDELPGLVNVLRGEMSLVGPRPLRTRYLERYSAAQRIRHAVPPGITGLAQVSGRNSLSWDDTFDLDAYYVRHRGPGMDFRIVLATVPLVLGRNGVAEDGCATRSDFYGPRRLGEHMIRPASECGTRWEVVCRESGEVVARCVLERGEDAESELRIDIISSHVPPALVRERAVEMLLGVAREQGFTFARFNAATEDAEAQALAASLGAVVKEECPGEGTSVYEWRLSPRQSPPPGCRPAPSYRPQRRLPWSRTVR